MIASSCKLHNCYYVRTVFNELLLICSNTTMCTLKIFGGIRCAIHCALVVDDN